MPVTSKPVPGLFLFSGPYIYIILCVLGIIIYSGTFNNQFVFDDYPNIVDNQYIRDFKDFRIVRAIFPARAFGLFTFMVNYRLHGLHVTGYHVVNLLIHILSSCMVYWLVSLILSAPSIQKDRISEHKHIIAGFSALLFLTHPVQTQAVSYIVQRLASLAALFYLSALGLYIKARLTDNKLIFRIFLFIAAGICAFLGMFTKETLFTLPFVILIFEFFLLRTAGKTLFKFDKIKLLWAIPFVLFVLLIPYLNYFNITYVLQPRISQRYGDPAVTPLYYLITQFKVIVYYIKLLFFPVNQRLDYDFPLSVSFFEPKVILSFIVLSALMYLAYYLYKRRKTVIALGIIWFFLTLSIESTIVPLSNVIFEHRLYLPMFGVVLLFVASLYYLLWKNHSKAMMIVLVTLVGILSVMTHQRNKVWKDNYTLWSDNVTKSPNKDRTHYNLGLALADRGMNDLAIGEFYRTLSLNPTHIKACISIGNIFNEQGNFNEAIKEFGRALEMNPDYEEVYFNRGNAYIETGKFNEAVRDFEKALALNPHYSDAFVSLGMAYYSLGRIDESIVAFNNALEIDSDNILAHYNLGYALYSQGKAEDAIKEFKTAASLDPENVRTLVNLGSALVSQRKFDEAAGYFRKALALDPAHENAHYKLGTILESQGKTAEALRHLQEAVRIRPDFADAHRKLATMYLAQGKTAEARAHLEKAGSIKK